MSTLNLQVGAGGDDGWWNASNFNNTDVGSTFGNNSGTVYNAFARFTNVTIPKASTISAAVLTFKASESLGSTVVSVAIKAIKENNAAAPT